MQILKHLATIILIFLVLGCKPQKGVSTLERIVEISNIETDNYVLKKPEADLKGVLILFGGYPQNPKDIMREFDIGDLLNENAIAVMYLKYNKRLWLEEAEKIALKTILEQAFVDNALPMDNIYIGGFSSGGNMTLLISNYLGSQNSKIRPQGIFVVDSPVDLIELYKCAKRNVERNFNAGSVRESLGIISRFDKKFGTAEDVIQSYKAYSPFINMSKHIDNLKSLKKVSIRLYTEPDTLWWRTNRMNEYEDMNAFYIKALAEELQLQFPDGDIKLIETKNKGYRANGIRHPHSWSIVDKPDLLNWILEGRTKLDVEAPPKPVLTLEEIALQEEIKMLNDERQIKVNQFVADLSDHCKTTAADTIILRLAVIPDGLIETHEIVKMSQASKFKRACVDNFIAETSIDLGRLKHIPSARAGSEAKRISYVLPIK